MCCRERFDRDELGIDPDDDAEGDVCQECGEPWSFCECEEEEEEDAAT